VGGEQGKAFASVAKSKQSGQIQVKKKKQTGQPLITGTNCERFRAGGTFSDPARFRPGAK